MLGFALLTVAFVATRRRLGLFVFAALATAGVLALALRALGPGDLRAESVALSGLGLALYAAGLALTRTMLQRSLSLHVLRALAAGRPADEVRPEIVTRLADLTRHGLATRVGERLVPTRRGQRVARVTGWLWTWMRVAP